MLVDLAKQIQSNVKPALTLFTLSVLTSFTIYDVILTSWGSNWKYFFFKVFLFSANATGYIFQFHYEWRRLRFKSLLLLAAQGHDLTGDKVWLVTACRLQLPYWAPPTFSHTLNSFCHTYNSPVVPYGHPNICTLYPTATFEMQVVGGKKKVLS